MGKAIGLVPDELSTKGIIAALEQNSGRELDVSPYTGPAAKLATQALGKAPAVAPTVPAPGMNI